MSGYDGCSVKGRLPSRGAVWSTLRTQWQYLASESVPTIEEVLLGFAAATIFGIAIAIAIVTWRPVAKAVYPLLVASQEVPQIDFAPLLLVWFGFGLTSKVIVAFLIAFFPIVVNTAAGLRSVSTELLDLAHSTRASGFTILRKIRFPFALPHILRGARDGPVGGVADAGGFGEAPGSPFQGPACLGDHHVDRLQAIPEAPIRRSSRWQERRASPSSVIFARVIVMLLTYSRADGSCPRCARHRGELPSRPTPELSGSA